MGVGDNSGKIFGKIEKLLDWNKKLCGSRYGHHDYDSGYKKTKRQKDKKTKRQKKAKRQKDKKAEIQKDKNTNRQKDKKTKRQKIQKCRGPEGPPRPPK